MSARSLSLLRTAALVAGMALAPLPAPPAFAADAPGTGVGSAAGGHGTSAAPDTGAPALGTALAELRRLHREAREATTRHRATEEALGRERARARRLDDELARARLALVDSREAAGRLARQQYQSRSGLSPYLGLLLARDPRHVLEQGRMIERMARERAATVRRLGVAERRAADLAGQAREALDRRLTLAERAERERDAARLRLDAVEEALAALAPTPGDASNLAGRDGVARARRPVAASGSSGTKESPPSVAGERALRFAVEQLGKPYEWGADGPARFDCSGLTHRAWERAGTVIPRTSQAQWAELERVPLDRLRPGDLVVYFPRATHVALYLGGGEVVHAPRPGSTVRISPVGANPILGAVRPDPGGRSSARYVPPALPEERAPGSHVAYSAAGPHPPGSRGDAGAVSSG
ncbi:NlpC/P60 family protein [Streptomyces sp. HSG2]|uniref:C40 family peptidase n=1 Tax=Streptomyces sp. HSG2 TaxID=2797167 RepID=UPI0019080BE2|nr:NlpC/P60 family protein [Streptomyces sp. HSG2]